MRKIILILLSTLLIVSIFFNVFLFIKARSIQTFAGVSSEILDAIERYNITYEDVEDILILTIFQYGENKQESSNKVVVFFKEDAEEERILELQDKLSELDCVQRVEYISSVEAVEIMRQTHPEIGDIDENVLPASLEIETSNKEEVISLLEDYKDDYSIEMYSD